MFKLNNSSKISLVVIFVVIFSGLSSVFAEDNFEQKGYLFAGFSVYQGSEQSMKDVYGTIPSFKFGGGFEMSKNFHLEGSFEGSGNVDGDPYLYNDGFDDVRGTANLKMTQLKLIGKYIFNGKSTRFYVGVGLMSAKITEEVSTSGYYGGEYYFDSNKDSFSATGAVVVVGINIPLDSSGKNQIYVEASGTSADYQGLDLGGSLFGAGFKFGL